MSSELGFGDWSVPVTDQRFAERVGRDPLSPFPYLEYADHLRQAGLHGPAEVCKWLANVAGGYYFLERPDGSHLFARPARIVPHVGERVGVQVYGDGTIYQSNSLRSVGYYGFDTQRLYHQTTPEPWWTLDFSVYLDGQAAPDLERHVRRMERMTGQPDDYFRFK